MKRIEFQIKAVEELIKQFKTLWKQPQRQIPITLKAPTGSGKTYMTQKFICDLYNQPDWYQDVAFVWITFSDDLAMQSREKFELYFPTTKPGRLLTIQNFQQGALHEKDVLFLNWQKLVAASAEKRVLRRPDDERDQKETGYYFEDIVEMTHAEGRQIILIIDESHMHVTASAQKYVIDPLDPKIILKVSATPDSEPSISDINNLRAGWYEVKREEVISEGLIKQEIVCQTEEDIKKYDGKDLDEVLLDLAIEKRESLVSDISKFGFDVNPLVIIQLPNNTSVDTSDETKEQVVTDCLIEKGVDPSRIAKWFENAKKPSNLEDNNSPYDYLLFKMAAGTGWDCPRAQVLVMYRDIQSDTFQTQTIGRIVRMPVDNDMQGAEIFRTGYIYTNYARKQVLEGKYDENGHKPKIFSSENIKGVKFTPDIMLETEYMPRVDYGDLGNAWQFQQCLIDTFNKYFGITKEDLVGTVRDKLRARHLILEPKLEQNIVVDARFPDLDQISFDFNGRDMKREWSKHDVQKLFTFMCMDLLRKQTEENTKITNIARSFGSVKSALRLWFRNYAFRGEDPDTQYRIFLADVINKGAGSIFLYLITETLRNHFPLREEQLQKRREEAEMRDTREFVIQKTYAYTEEYEELEMKRCLLKPFYIRKEYKGRVNEENFAKYLDQQECIEWWIKNGDTGKDWLSIRYFNEEEEKLDLFYPDWIYKKKDGTIGIWDTKDGETASKTETYNKADELQKRIKRLNSLNREGIRYEGGIVIPSCGAWYYNSNDHYSFSSKNSNGWNNFMLLFNDAT